MKVLEAAYFNFKIQIDQSKTSFSNGFLPETSKSFSTNYCSEIEASIVKVS